MPVRRSVHKYDVTFLVLPMITGACMLAAWIYSSRVEGWGSILWWEGLSLIFAIGTLVGGVNLLMYLVTNWRQAWIESGLLPPVDDKADVKLALANVIRGMTPEQVAAFGRGRVDIEITSGHGTPPHKWLVLPEGRISWDDVSKFMERCDDTHLASIRWFGEGSRMRQAAQWMTAHFIADGLAAGDIGNESAAWVSVRAFEEAKLSIGFVDVEPEDII